MYAYPLVDWMSSWEVVLNWPTMAALLVWSSRLSPATDCINLVNEARKS